VWENIPSTPGVSDLVPWLGTYHGVPAAMKSIEVVGAAVDRSPKLAQEMEQHGQKCGLEAHERNT
jgi:hypothetical protein